LFISQRTIKYQEDFAMTAQGLSLSTQEEREATRPATWWQALTLAERGTASAMADTGSDVALRRYQRWLEEANYLDAATVTTYLAEAGFTADELMAILAEDATTVQTRLPGALPWLADLQHAYREAVDDDTTLHFGPEAGFLTLTAPLIAWAVQGFHEQLGKLDAAICTNEFANRR